MTADSVGGVLTYALTLASELAKAGTKVHLAMLGPKQDPAQEAAIRAVPGLVLHESTFALEWMDESGADIPRASEWLRGIERDVRPDIIHLNGYCHGAAGFKAPVVIVAHYCALSWWESVEGGTLPERYSTYREAARRGLQAADAVIAVSQSMRANLERHYGALPRVAVIPNGRAVENPSSHEKEPFVLAAGRLSDKAKNIDALARVAKDLPWPVKIAGRRQDEPQKYVDSGVESLGWLPPAELGRLMARAAVFALPARYEPFGVSALEAALHGCALVLGDIPSLRELWGDAALYVRPDDDDGLKKAIAKLAGDASLRADMAAAAKLHGQLFTPARNARAMRDLYETMILARQLPAVTGAPGRETRSA
ncbi:MAG TPA: glycosyltransferase family 4 protein [Labilithrix sp.]|nr:glycosyltransferase family 4 protein [Labilithrix sp.]